MFSGKRIAVVVPAHNEERLLPRTLASIPDYVDDVIVVDDASTDSTARVAIDPAWRPGVVLIRHEINRGVGGAIVTGYESALALGADVVAVMAGDAQMDPEDLSRLVEPVAAGWADYAKGDRLSWPEARRRMPPARYLGNHLFSVLTRLTSGYREVRDSQCGYTAVSRQTLSRLALRDLYARYGFPNDLLAHLHSLGCRLFQAPVRPIYGEEVSGISLFTALVRVPLVLLRSWVARRRRAMPARHALLETARPER
jgi:glycosyltransferase involved in cell wall biosynthesis